MHLGDIWKTSGDFSIPKSDPVKYRKLEKDIQRSMKKLDAEDRELKQREEKGEAVKKLRRRWKETRAAVVHWSDHVMTP
jgi:DNA repair ATPase RecN